jgi:hypothetical protein
MTRIRRIRRLAIALVGPARSVPPGQRRRMRRVAWAAGPGLVLGVLGGAVAGWPLGPARAVAAVVNTQAAVAWGFNGDGELGDGTTTGRAVFGAVSELGSGVVQVAGGIDFSLAVTSSGTAWAWGAGNSGQLGDGSTTGSLVPVQVKGLTGAVAMAAGFFHSLALRSDGTVWAWGDNSTGELGNGTTVSSSVPVRVKGLTGITQISAGANYSLALRSDGTVWAWGGNQSGELGTGTTAGSSVPVRVPGLSHVTRIAAGSYSGYAITTGSTGQTSLWGWGAGPVGDGTTAARLTPVRVTGISAPAIADITAGTNYALALGADGSVWGWGDDTVGELGNGPATNPVLRPVQTRLAGSGITQLAASTQYFWGGLFGVHVFTLALTGQGTVWGWGDNFGGELGNGTTSTSPSGAVQVAGLAGVTQIAAGSGFSLAVTTFTRVPTVVGDTTGTASSVLQASGFVLGQVSSAADYTCNYLGVIMSQSPTAGTWAKYGSPVSVTVGTRPPTPCP